MSILIKMLVLFIIFLVVQKTVLKFYDVIVDYIKKKISNFWMNFSDNLKELNRTSFKIKAKDFRPIYLSALGLWFLIILFLTGSIFLGVVLSLPGMYLPTFLINVRKHNRTIKVESQLVDGLTILCNSLRAGLDLVQGMEIMVRDMPPPISEEFGLVLQEYKLGATLESALYNLRARLVSKYINVLVTAVIIQRESGGNITKILTRVVETIREGYRLDGKVKTLTAQGKMQSWIILGLPWLMALMLTLVQPQFMVPMFTHPLGLIILLFLIFWQIIGMIVIKRVTIVKV